MSALYDAGEYLVAGPENQAEWWEHLGDAHRDYRALAEACAALVADRDHLRRENERLWEALRKSRGRLESTA